MFQTIHPWKGNPTQLKIWKIYLLPEEGHQLGLASVGIGICGEVEIMGGSILLTGV